MEHPICDNCKKPFANKYTLQRHLFNSKKPCKPKEEPITQHMQGYIIGKQNFYYKTNDENIAAIYSHISQNRIDNIEKFLAIALEDK